MARRTSRSSAASSPALRSACRAPSTARRQTRSRNRPHPSITLSVWSDQSTSSAGGPTKRWKRRRASAPTVVRIARGRDEVPLRLRHLLPVHPDHPLGEQPREGLAEPLRREAEVGEGLRVEACVEEMEDGVLDAADVLVDRHPVPHEPGVEGAVGRPGVAESEEVPRRVDEGVHRVGLAGGRSPADRAGGVEEPLVGGERRLAGRAELDVVGREDRQLLDGDRDRSPCSGQ